MKCGAPEKRYFTSSLVNPPLVGFVAVALVVVAVSSFCKACSMTLGMLVGCFGSSSKDRVRSRGANSGMSSVWSILRSVAAMAAQSQAHCT